MIYLDRREPEDLYKAIRRLGVEATWTPALTLEDGDIFFEGNGEHGEAMVALERKKLPDLVACMKDRRLAGKQLRGMRGTYDYIFLVCEGLWRPGPSGEIQHWGWKKIRKNGNWIRAQDWVPYYTHVEKTAINYRQLASFLHSLTLRCRAKNSHEPLRILRSGSLEETAALVVSLYRNFTEKTWGEHHAHDEIYCGLPQKGHGGGWAQPHSHARTYEAGRSGGRKSTASFGDDGHPSSLWRMAAQLPGVDRKAQELTEFFGTARNMTLAGLDPRLRKQVDLWFSQNYHAQVKAWQTALGVVEGKAKAEAAIRALTVVGG